MLERHTRHFARTSLGRWLPMDLGALVVTAPVVSHTVTALGAELTVRFDQTRHYYGPDNKLRVLNRVIGPTGPAHAGSVYEEYRYDALGRRVLVRSRSLAGCGMTPCPQSYIERTVWDGDQVLVEVRAPGDNEVSDWDLESDNATSSSAQSYAWGRVLYVHGPGIDAPLMVLRSGMSDQPTLVTIFPHANWRGEYTNGSHPGSQTTNTQCAGNYGCPAISWPGAGAHGRRGAGAGHVVAGRVGGKPARAQDRRLGLQYMRNRYYDPATGKFTQVDPIGLAGGLNLYGFANGDAINFSDPFGLYIVPIQHEGLRGIIAKVLASSPTFSKMFVAMAMAPANRYTYTIQVTDAAGVKAFSGGENTAAWIRCNRRGCTTMINGDLMDDDKVIDEFIHAAAGGRPEVAREAGIPPACHGHTAYYHSSGCSEIREMMLREARRDDERTQEKREP